MYEKVIQEDVSNDGLSIFKRYPEKELYRLIVDGCNHKTECGWIAYEEREPGCLKAAFNGLAFALKDLDKKELSIETIKELHIAFSTNVKCLNKPNIPGKFRNLSDRNNNEIGICFGLELTKDGLRDLMILIKEQDEKNLGGDGFCLGMRGVLGLPQLNTVQIFYTLKDQEITNDYVEKLYQLFKDKDLVFFAPETKDIQNRVQFLVDSYNKHIKSAVTQDEKLEVIVDHIYKLEHLHPFPDANIRTLVIGLLTRLLVQNGFPPATLYNPNFFDGYSKKELVEAIKKAIEVTQSIVAGKEEIYGFKSSSIPQERQMQYADMISGLTKQLKISGKSAIKSSQTLDAQLMNVTDSVKKVDAQSNNTNLKDEKNEHQTSDLELPESRGPGL